MSKQGYCHSCGETAELRECVECGAAYCCKECSEGWAGDICPFCQDAKPVFFDVHSRTAGAVDPKDGATR